jgi:uncharacterized protein
MEKAQREVVAFLRDASSYPPGIGRIEVIETHASLVFLAGEYAYKLKRAVKYPYLDFSSAERRLAACTAELQLNRRTAAPLYLEVRAISRGPDGRLGWRRHVGDQAGEVLDFVVVMKRFGQEDLFDKLARQGGLSASLLYALTAHIAQFHGKAEKRPNSGGAAVMAALVETNLACLRDRNDASFDAAQIGRVEHGFATELARIGGVLDERRAAGNVRLCHGDLHLRNICLVDGKPLLFDCLEFSEDLASIDVLYDLAFLLMDLGHCGHADFASLVFNRYLDLTEQDEGIAAMPLFLAMRAVIRAHVTATMAAHGWSGDDAEAARSGARRYLDDAEAALRSEPARLVAIGGLSGSGKSTLAARLAPGLGRPPGARVLRSDVLRKLRFATEPETPLPPEAYVPEVNAVVYRDLCERAATALRAGYSAVIDAVALRQDERRAFAAVAADAGVPFTGLWLAAPEETMAARLGARTGDASDASAEVLQLQLGQDAGAVDWTRIDAAGDPDATLVAARRALGH